MHLQPRPRRLQYSNRGRSLQQDAQGAAPDRWLLAQSVIRWAPADALALPNAWLSRLPSSPSAFGCQLALLSELPPPSMAGACHTLRNGQQRQANQLRRLCISSRDPHDRMNPTPQTWHWAALSIETSSARRKSSHDLKHLQSDIAPHIARHLATQRSLGLPQIGFSDSFPRSSAIVYEHLAKAGL
jgi:hypothetical protein